MLATVAWMNCMACEMVARLRKVTGTSNIPSRRICKQQRMLLFTTGWQTNRRSFSYLEPCRPHMKIWTTVPVGQTATARVPEQQKQGGRRLQPLHHRRHRPHPGCHAHRPCCQVTSTMLGKTMTSSSSAEYRVRSGPLSSHQVARFWVSFNR